VLTIRTRSGTEGRIMRTGGTSEAWQPYGKIAIASGQLLLADPAYIDDLLPQIKSADLREIAQIIPTGCPDGTHQVSVLRAGEAITAVRVDLGT
jgi:hypothetical protein